MSFSAACFEFASGPPVNDTKRSQTHLREWNADINSSDDIFNLNELEEFKSTDITSLILGRTPKRSNSEGPLQEPPSKRRKLDMASLRNAIPQVVYFIVLIIHSFSRKKIAAPCLTVCCPCFHEETFRRSLFEEQTNTNSTKSTPSP